jgi:hypothetical protein
VRIRIIIAAAFGVALAVLNAFVGCATAPATCPVSPIDIEEVRSDTRGLEVQLAEQQKRLKVAQDDLARWEARFAQRKEEKPVLRAELDRLKKMSGVTEKVDIDIKPKTPVRDDGDIDIDVR